MRILTSAIALSYLSLILRSRSFRAAAFASSSLSFLSSKSSTEVTTFTFRVLIVGCAYHALTVVDDFARACFCTRPYADAVLLGGSDTFFYGFSGE